MTTALLPRLRPLDERVLSSLSTARGQRAGSVAALLLGRPHWECERCGHVERERMWGGGREAWLKYRKRRLCCDCRRWLDPGTRVTDEHGREVRGVQSIEWSITVPDGALAKITLKNVPVKMTTDAEVRDA